MSSWLSIGNQNRSRSKSPGGQDRERDRSKSRNDDRDYDNRKARGNGTSQRSHKYSESESSSDSEDDRRRRKSSSKKRDDSDDDRYRSKPKKEEKHSSRRRDETDSEDDRRRRRREREAAEEEKRKSSHKSSRKKSDSDSESDRKKDRRKKASKGDSSDEDDISIVIQRKSKSKKDDEKTTPRTSAPAVTSAPVSQVPSYTQPAGYPYVPAGYVPQPPGAFQQEPLTRHMSYVGPADRQYAPPAGAYPEDPLARQNYMGQGDRHAPPPAPVTRHMSYVGQDDRQYAPPAAAHMEVPYRPRAASNAGPGPQYADVGQYKYAQVDPQVAYKYDNRGQPQTTTYDPRMGPPQARKEPFSRDKKYYEDKYDRDAKPRGNQHERRPSTLETRPSGHRMSSAGLGATLGATLGVAGHNVMSGNGGKPPGSPLLEAYKGTYQSISPMPSALVLAEHKNDSDLSDFDLSSDSDIPDGPNADLKRKIRALEKEKERAQKLAEHEHKLLMKKEHERRHPEQGQRKHADQHAYEDRAPDDMMVGPVIPRSPMGGKKVSFYDPEDDAKAIAAALKGTQKAANVKPLIRILPRLTADDLDALKAEYKKHAKIDGVGISMSKHIKTRVTGYIGKAAYACSLGQWESESFWANCYYQAGASRRELLIESLMGRTNQQIREIKNFFKDKKYDDDLEKCMKTELKADKFRSAILLALSERRQAESPLPDVRLVKQDVQLLHQALESAGGETAMIEIIVIRSDTHLREVLRVYERAYGRNFARDMINKSRNLVGETLAHILNGALNRPMRDTLLLHQAIAETAPGKDRAELLISRLIRLHWDPKHLEKVKAQYHSKYGIRLVDAIKREIQANMKTEEGLAWTNFCIELLRSSED